MTGRRSPNICNIPAGLSFVDSLATGIMKQAGVQPDALSRFLVLLPTRRACRSLREGFLRLSEGKPLLLPRMQPIGDIDEEELFLSVTDDKELNIPPALSPLRRQLMLAKLIGRLPDYSKGPEQDMALAAALGRLMDHVYTENLDLKDLPGLVDEAALSQHWQITVTFLTILSEKWPQVLEENGVIENADRRSRLIKALTKHWQNASPDFPVIAAGSTGSIPATAELLKTISLLPQGCVVLPGLDQEMDTESWDAIGDTHPQATIKHLLTMLDCQRTDIHAWPGNHDVPKKIKMRRLLSGEIMRPSDTTEKWQSISYTVTEKNALKESLSTVRRYDCGTAQEEALLIALLLRETLEDKNKTAAVITADRKLARRIAMACRRWNIEIDDSGGQPLSDTSAGSFLRLSAQACAEQLSPSPLLSLLKHRLFNGDTMSVRQLEQQLLRGPKPPLGIEGLYRRFDDWTNDEDRYEKPDPETKEFISWLESKTSPFLSLAKKGYNAFPELLGTHIRLAEELAGKENLWRREDGETAALFLADLKDHSNQIPDMRAHEYCAIINQLMKSLPIRPAYGMHPRLVILGQLEARLIQADRVILAGLNEGSWPPDPGNDPWMSRPMRKDFGLPSPEREIGLAAHDFVQGFCAPEIFMTRSQRIDGQPTLPARWLQRMQTVLQALEIELPQGPHKTYIHNLDKNSNSINITRPAPKPPVEARPHKLSVTKIETLLRDPYSIYARSVLKLRKLDAIDKPVDAADRGTLLHSILERFTTEFPQQLPPEAQSRFLAIANNELDKRSDDPAIWSFWNPRMIRLSDWLISHEKNWRQGIASIHSERKGELVFEKPSGKSFTLTGRADRIDLLQEGGTAIIDYKSGGTYSIQGIASGSLPQLPLEGLILSKGGFPGIKGQDVKYLSYWKLTGAHEAGNITGLSGSAEVTKSIEAAQQGLQALINIFDDANTPYYSIPDLDNAPRYNDYEHLARVKEWAALDDSEEAA